MTEQQPPPTPKPKSSEDLIREARAATTGGNEGATASGALMEEARSWLAAEVEADAAAETAPLPSETMDPEISFEPEPASMLPPTTASPPRPRRATRRPKSVPRPAPTPTSAPDPEVAARRRRKFWLVAGILIAVALVGNIASVIERNTVQEPGVIIEGVPVTVRSAGSITSMSDPCTGAEISGDLELEVARYDYSDSTMLDVYLLGQLEATDGHTYTIEAYAIVQGDAGQRAFVFPTDVMLMTRSDGLVFEQEATFTVEFEGDEISYWEYESDGAACPE